MTTNHNYFKKNLQLRTLSYLGILSTIIFFLNYIIGSFTIMGGYVSLGDVVFIFCCYRFRWKENIILAILPFALSDFLLGAPQYILFTIIIRLSYIIIFSFYKKIAKNNKNWFLLFFSILFTQIIMIFGYFVADSIFYLKHFQPLSYLVLDIYYNLIQGAITTLASYIIIFIIKNTKYLKRKNNI